MRDVNFACSNLRTECLQPYVLILYYTIRAAENINHKPAYTTSKARFFQQLSVKDRVMKGKKRSCLLTAGNKDRGDSDQDPKRCEEREGETQNVKRGRYTLSCAHNFRMTPILQCICYIHFVPHNGARLEVLILLKLIITVTSSGRF